MPKTAPSCLAICFKAENGFLDPALAALREYDISLIAIRKLSTVLNSDVVEGNLWVLRRLSPERLRQAGLLDYEIEKIRQAF
jgi:hypothetical protein